MQWDGVAEIPQNEADRKRPSPFEDGETARETKRHAVGDEGKLLPGHPTITRFESPLKTAEVEMEVVMPSLQELAPVAEFQGTCRAMDYAGPAECNAVAESGPKYDTCFGVVVVQMMLDSAFTHASKQDEPPLLVRASGNTISLYDKRDGFLGLFISDCLCSLLGQFSVHLTATLLPTVLSTHEASTPSGRGKAGRKVVAKQSTTLTDGLTRVVVYGLLADRDLIGKRLSEEALYLQHPTPDEFDPSTEYFNPHLLLRPGATMPRIEELSVDNGDEISSGPTALDEVSKARIWRVFDLASGTGAVPEITPSPRLKSTLEEHQRAALEMMIERECGVIREAKFPTLWDALPSALGRTKLRYRNKVTGRSEENPVGLRGGNLADEMGLGKTLSTLALICWSLDTIQTSTIDGPKDCKATLVVVPMSTLLGWEAQIKKHIFRGRMTYITYHGSSRHINVRGITQHDVVLTTYDVLRIDFKAVDEKDTIYSHKWRRVVLDEAHRIRSRSSQLHDAAIAISKLAQTRWCLTGTPIHNALDDYAALLSFLRVQDLHEKKTFDRFVTAHIKQNRSNGMERLQALVRATSLRRTISLNGASLGLPSRSETSQFVDLDARDAELYRFFQEKSSAIAKSAATNRRGKKPSGTVSNKGDGNILSLILFLRFICNYGGKMLPQPALEAWKADDLGAVDMQQLQRSCARCNGPLRQAEGADTLPCGHVLCSKCIQTLNESDGNDEMALGECSACQRSDSLQWKPGESPGRSAKVEALIRNLRGEQQPRSDGARKSVVFSCWTKMLDLVQRDLAEEGFSLERIDGQATLDQRRTAIRRFKEDPNCTVMLASIGSAGEGIDLISASNVHILEPQWNPMVESQAIGRVHRYGQTKRVAVTRYIVKKSIETYIQWIQEDKLRLISRSINDDPVSQQGVNETRWERLQDTFSG